MILPSISLGEVIDVNIKGVDDGIKTTKQNDYKEAVLFAKREAIERAGVKMKSLTTVKDMVINSDYIESKAEAVLMPGYNIIDIGYIADGTYQIVLIGKVSTNATRKETSTYFAIQYQNTYLQEECAERIFKANSKSFNIYCTPESFVGSVKLDDELIIEYTSSILPFNYDYIVLVPISKGKHNVSFDNKGRSVLSQNYYFEENRIHLFRLGGNTINKSKEFESKEELVKQNLNSNIVEYKDIKSLSSILPKKSIQKKPIKIWITDNKDYELKSINKSGWWGFHWNGGRTKCECSGLSLSADKDYMTGYLEDIKNGNIYCQFSGTLWGLHKVQNGWVKSPKSEEIGSYSKSGQKKVSDIYFPKDSYIYELVYNINTGDIQITPKQ
jgi:hypothetical protein